MFILPGSKIKWYSKVFNAITATHTHTPIFKEYLVKNNL